MPKEEAGYREMKRRESLNGGEETVKEMGKKLKIKRDGNLATQ